MTEQSNLSRNCWNCFPEIGKISASLGNLLWLAFSGGEPFLRQDLVEIAEVFYKRNRPCIILIPTNGLLPDVIVKNTEEILKRCRKSTIAVKLSLDGPLEVHDRSARRARRIQQDHGDLQAFARVARPLPELRTGHQFRSLQREPGQDGRTDRFGQQLEGVRAHTVSLIRGEVAEARLKKVAPEVYARIGERLAQDLRSRAAGRYRFSGAGLKAAQDILQRRLIHRTLVGKKRQIPCFAGRLSLVLTETGDVIPASRSMMKMGNVRDYGCDVKKLLESERGEKGRRFCPAEQLLLHARVQHDDEHFVQSRLVSDLTQRVSPVGVKTTPRVTIHD